MRIFSTLLFLIFSLVSRSETFTMISGADYQDASNWDTYPGTTLFDGDTIVIDVSSLGNFSLTMWGGHLLFTEEVNTCDVGYWEIYNSSTVEFEGNWIIIHIFGEIYYEAYQGINLDNSMDVSIINLDEGFNGIHTALENLYADFQYENEGTEDAHILDLSNLNMTNWGTLMAYPGDIYIYCHLELASGTITGYDPYQLIQIAGEIKQSCTNCTSYITNASSVQFVDAEIQGNLIID